MRYIADLHIHSHFSRATSKDLDLEHLYYWAQLKGIRVVGTGDIVHPGWLKEVSQKLEPAEPGLYRLKSPYAKAMDALIPPSCRQEVRFLLTVEISNIYKRANRVRKVHNLIWLPDLESANLLSKRLGAIGNINSDGRPILGLDSRDLLEIALTCHPQMLFVPAHIWTPWFSVLGSMGGFDLIQDCFADLTHHIHAVETGLSSDPIMNWRLSQLDPYILVSNSDAHSPGKLGREANVFDTDLSYDGIYRALVNKNDQGLVSTIEFFPEEGKYHLDGHRACGVRLHPKETRALGGLCPQCQKPVTVGVMARVEDLADRGDGVKGARWRPYQSIVPLLELIAHIRQMGPGSKAVTGQYHAALTALGSEFFILLDAPLSLIAQHAGEQLMRAIASMRQGKVKINAGYDGEFGTIDLEQSADWEDPQQQVALYS